MDVRSFHFWGAVSFWSTPFWSDLDVLWAHPTYVSCRQRASKSDGSDGNSDTVPPWPQSKFSSTITYV